MPAILDINAIRADLKYPIKLFCHDEIDSTSTQARRLAENGLRENALVAASFQSSGRGRLGRSFYSPCGTGLYMSILCFPHRPIEQLLTMTAALSVAVRRAVYDVSGIGLGIKWVNDLYLGDKKAAGILTEAFSVGEEYNAVIIGVGININTEKFPEDIPNPASLGLDVPREKLAAAVCNEILAALDNLNDKSYIDEYRRYSILVGRKIYYIRNGEKKPGEAVGIDDLGGLVVRTENGTVTLDSGDVSIRFRE